MEHQNFFELAAATTNSSDCTSVSALREARLAGEISREQFWREVGRASAAIADLQIVGSSRVELRIRLGQLLVTYELINNAGTHVTLLLDPTDLRSAGVTILCEGHYEPVQEELIVSLALMSQVMFDIGANAGFYSAACAVANPELRVIAFEPNPQVWSTFLSNMEFNRVETQVELKQIALSDQDGQLADLYVPAFTGSGGASLRNLHPEEGLAQLHTVPIRALDALETHLPGCDLIKIDCEGNELGVLLGASHLLESEFPTIVIELLRKWMAPFGTHPQEAVDLLLSFGYQCYEIGQLGLIPINRITYETQGTNFVFVNPQRETHFKLVQDYLAQ